MCICLNLYKTYKTRRTKQNLQAEKGPLRLKQAAKTWNIRISKSLNNLRFVQRAADQYLVTRKKENKTSYLIIYVEDLLISGITREINNIIEELQEACSAKPSGKRGGCPNPRTS